MSPVGWFSITKLDHPLYPCCCRLRLPTYLYNFGFNFSVTTLYAFPINKVRFSDTFTLSSRREKVVWNWLGRKDLQDVRSTAHLAFPCQFFSSSPFGLTFGCWILLLRQLNVKVSMKQTVSRFTQKKRTHGRRRNFSKGERFFLSGRGTTKNDSGRGTFFKKIRVWIGSGGQMSIW